MDVNFDLNQYNASEGGNMKAKLTKLESDREKRLSSPDHEVVDVD